MSPGRNVGREAKAGVVAVSHNKVTGKKHEEVRMSNVFNHGDSNLYHLVVLIKIRG